MVNIFISVIRDGMMEHPPIPRGPSPCWACSHIRLRQSSGGSGLENFSDFSILYIYNVYSVYPTYFSKWVYTIFSIYFSIHW